MLYCCSSKGRSSPSGGRGKLLSEDQEHAVVGLAIADNAIKLREIQSRIVEDNLVFHSVENISLTTMAWTLNETVVHSSC